MYKTAAVRFFLCTMVSLVLVSCSSLKSEHYVGEQVPIQEDLAQESIWQFEDQIFYVRGQGMENPGTMTAWTLNWNESENRYEVIESRVVVTQLKLKDSRALLFLNLKEEKDDLYKIFRLIPSTNEQDAIIFTVDAGKIKEQIKNGKVKAFKKDGDFILQLTKKELDRYIKENADEIFDFSTAGIIRSIKGFGSQVKKMEQERPVLPSSDVDRKVYKNTIDPIKKSVVVDKNLKSRFFKSHKSSLKWYIIKTGDNTFENTLGGKVTDEDKIPLEHTSNCVSTHQGSHGMNFCDAALESGVLRLKIHGGMPAYSSSMLIEVRDNSDFFCFFNGVYPASGADIKWRIISKELKFKNLDFKKGRRLFAWVSVRFEEKTTYRGETIVNVHTIEGFIKPLIH